METSARDCFVDTREKLHGFQPSCPQPKQQDTGKFSEDCLYLNVWTTAENQDKRLPVMVWIHAAPLISVPISAEYNGKNLAKKAWWS